MKVWRAFRGSVLWAVIITAVLWGLSFALSSWPSGDESPDVSEELPALSPTRPEHVMMVLAVVATFLVVLTLIVAYSLVRGRVKDGPRRHSAAG